MDEIRRFHVLVVLLVALSMVGIGTTCSAAVLDRLYLERSRTLSIELHQVSVDIADLAVRLSGRDEGEVASSCSSPLNNACSAASYLNALLSIEKWINRDYLDQYYSFIRAELEHRKKVLDMNMGLLNLAYSNSRSHNLTILIDKARGKVRDLVSLIDEMLKY